MKRARNRFVRYLSVLFILLFLFSGCEKEKPLFIYALRDAYFSYPNGRGNCNAIQCDTDLFDPNDVTLTFHYGRLKGTDAGAGATYMDHANTDANVTRMDIYVRARELNYSYDDGSGVVTHYLNVDGKPYLIKSVEDDWRSEKYLCECSYAENPTAHGVWEKITIPREIFTEEEGCFTVYVQFTTKAQEKNIPFNEIKVYYETLKNGKVRLRFPRR